MTRRLGCLVLAAVFTSGCMTIDTQRDADYDGPQVYSGFRKDVNLFSQAFISFAIGWVALTAVDMPFSLVADTVLLPWTIPKDRETATKQTEAARVDAERPSAIKAKEGESPGETAQKLFKECARLLHANDPAFTDCYSIDSKVEIYGSDPIKGAEYKPKLRADLARWKSDGETIEWRDPQYGVDGDKVHVNATRAVSTSGKRQPVILLLGPGSDGQWRILEELSPGLTR